MATRGIFKNPSLVSFSTTNMLGVMSFSWEIGADVDRNSADNETSSRVYGVQNFVGNAAMEGGDIKDVVATGGFSVGESRSLRATAVAKFSSTETDLTVIIATAYCSGIYGDDRSRSAAGRTIGRVFESTVFCHTSALDKCLFINKNLHCTFRKEKDPVTFLNS